MKTGHSTLPLESARCVSQSWMVIQGLLEFQEKGLYKDAEDCSYLVAPISFHSFCVAHFSESLAHRKINLKQDSSSKTYMFAAP